MVDVFFERASNDYLGFIKRLGDFNTRERERIKSN